MKIEVWEGASAVWSNVKGAADWLGTLVPENNPIFQFLKGKLKTFNVKGMLGGIADFAQDLGSKAVNAGRKGYNFLRQWFEDDPIGATAGIIAGGLAIPAVVSVGGLVGSLGAGGLALLGKGALAFKGAAVTGGIMSVIPTIKSLGGFLVEKQEVILNFDWNISDEDIKRIQEESFTEFKELAGPYLQEALMSIVCSAQPGLSSVEIDYALLAKVQMLLPEETIEQGNALLADFSIFIKHIGLYLTFLRSFQSVRDWIQGGVVTGIDKVDKAIASWGQEGTESWTFAKKIEEIRQTIDSSTLAGMSLDYLDDLLDSCHDFTLTAT